VTGPFETESDALEEIRKTAADVARAYRTPAPATQATARGILEAALDDIELGTYDRRVIDWLGTWEAGTIVVLAGIIERAKALSAGR
jgi:hypothetical protein